MAQQPIIFDRTTGEMTGATPWERSIGFALLAGSKVGAYMSHRGYNTRPSSGLVKSKVVFKKFKGP